jgi:hypothetical protein
MKELTKTKQSAIQLNQIRRRIELEIVCMREIILRFDMNFFLIIQFNTHFNANLLGCRDPQGITVHQQRLRPKG